MTILTSYRRDGSAVRTPVRVVWDGDRGWLRTTDHSGKLERVWRDPKVEITGIGAARARILTGEEADAAARRFGRLLPILHRLRGAETMHVELRSN